MITWSTKIIETIHADGSISVSDKSPYNDTLRNVLLADMISNNLYPPVSFVFSREAYNHIGSFREDLPVLGDWEFNLRFVASYEVGVIPKLLANYHHRVACSSPELWNSVHSSQIEHSTYDAELRNEALRA